MALWFLSPSNGSGPDRRLAPGSAVFLHKRMARHAPPPWDRAITGATVIFANLDAVAMDDLRTSRLTTWDGPFITRSRWRHPEPGRDEPPRPVLI